MYDPWPSIMAISNIAVYGSIFIAAVWHVRHNRGVAPTWLRIGQAITALYWCMLYVYILIEEPGYTDPVIFGQIFIRPMFLITGAIMLAGVLATWRRGIR